MWPCGKQYAHGPLAVNKHGVRMGKGTYKGQGQLSHDSPQSKDGEKLARKPSCQLVIYI